MDEVNFRPRRQAAGFRIEDTRTGELVPGEEHEEVFAADQAAAALERAEWAVEVAARLEQAGSPALAAELREGIPRDVLLARLRGRARSGGDAEEILAGAPAEL